MQEPIVFLQHQQAVGGSMALRVSMPVARALQVNDPLLLPATPFLPHRPPEIRQEPQSRTGEPSASLHYGTSSPER